MKSLLGLFLLLTLQLNSQTEADDVPTGVRLTPTFLPPPVVADKFKQAVPGVTPKWTSDGETITATYADLLQKTHMILYDRNGNMLGSHHQLSEKMIPKPVNGFFERYYPGENYTTWMKADSAGSPSYYSLIRGDTILFNKNGQYASDAKKLSTASEEDYAFVRAGTAAAIMEVTSAQLALVNANSPQVKELAQERIKKCTDMYQELQQLAVERLIPVPTELDKKQQKQFDALSNLQGPAFEKKYLKQSSRERKKNICRLKKAAKKADDPALRKWAADALTREQTTPAPKQSL